MSEQAETTEVASDVEGRARAMGWVPKDEFRGDPEKWRPADEFVERGEHILPILKERNEKLASEIARQNQSIAELRSTLDEVREFYSKAEQRAYERAVKDLKARQREAVANGDTEAFEQIDREISELNKDVQEHKKKPSAPALSPEAQAAFQAWSSENKWYTEDPELKRYADKIGEFVVDTKPHLIGTPQFLAEVSKLVKKAHPEKFENPAREGAPSVEGAARAPRGKAKRSYENLPSEAKAQCEKFERTIKGFKRDEYVKNFDWDGYEAARR